MAKLQEYLLVTVPGNVVPSQKTWEQLNKATKKKNLSKNWIFNVPNLKVGTLDQLVEVSDDVTNLDSYSEQVMRKVASYTREIIQDPEELNQILLIRGQDFHTSLIKFQWDVAKYPTNQSLKNIQAMISRQVSDIDSELKKRSKAYNGLKFELLNRNKRKTGSLMSRDISEYIRKEHIVLGSEYLITLIVILPLDLISEWAASYETITDMVVPRSTEFVYQDNEYALVTVTLFRKVVDEFKHKAKERKFVVKDFEFNQEEIDNNLVEDTKLASEIQKKHGPLVRWLKTNFAESFEAWIHIKILRIFSESVLRYGLPVCFQAILILPEVKAERKLREILKKIYGQLDSTTSYYECDYDIPPGLGLNPTEYFPYVSTRINMNLS